MTKLQLTLKFLETRIDSRDFEFVKAIWSKGDVRPSRTVSIYGGGSGYDFIESIKVYRACTGLGLKEAKDAIEAAREKPVLYTFEDQ